MSSLFDVVSFMKSKSHKESGKHFAFEYDEYSEEDTKSTDFYKSRTRKGNNDKDS